MTVLLASTGETSEFDRDRFRQKYGVEPEQFVDVKALMGDTSDNIPGVPGVGEKTALRLISQFGSLDGVYGNTGTGAIAGAADRKLIAGKDSAYLSQALARIKCDVPLGLTLDGLKYSGFDRPELRELLTELELSSLIKRLGLDSDEPEVAGIPGAEEKEKKACEIITVSAEELEGKNINRCSAAFCEDENGKYALFYDGDAEYRVDYTDAHIFERFFAEKGRTVVVSDSKKLCLEVGKPECGIFDVTLAAYVDDSSAGGYGLSRLSVKYLGKALSDGCDPAPVLSALEPVLAERLKESGQDRLYRDIEEPLAYVLAGMEKVGFKIDRAGLSEYSDELDRMCSEYTLSLTHISEPTRH